MSQRVLMVSKPVVPPWNDSSKNLVRDIVLGTDGVEFTVLTDGSASLDAAHVEERPVYRGRGRFAPSIWQNARVAATLLADGRSALHHFFFAPNPRTSRVIRGIRRLRRRPAVHTICSVPARFEGIARHVFADVCVALSAHTADGLKAAGVPDVLHIPPCIAPLRPRLDPKERRQAARSFGLPEHRPVVLFPGDYGFSDTASVVADAAQQLGGGGPPLTWVFACRLKRPEDREIEAAIMDRLAALVDAGRALFFNQVDNIHDLIAAASLVVLPATSTYAKMDLPLVLLEAMALGRPVLVSDCPPLDELPTESCGWAVPAGDPAALAARIADVIEDDAALRQRGEAAARMAPERYGREAVAGQYLALYRELL